MDDIETLEEFGMSKSEAKIYLTLLRNGPLTSGRIVTMSKQHVSVVYYSLHRLLEKGLVTYVKKGRFEEYSVTNPEIFLEKLKAMTENLQSKLPQWKLQAEYSKAKVTVEVFEGTKGIINMYNQNFRDAKKGEEFRIFSVGEEYKDPAIVSFLTKLNLKQQKLGLNVKMIVNKAHKDIFTSIEDPHYLKTVEKMHVRFMPFDFPQGITIFRDKVTFIFFIHEPNEVLITNANLAQQYAKFFDKLYEKGEPYKPNLKLFKP